MITSRIARFYAMFIGILVCALFYSVLIVPRGNASCIGHECGGPYVTYPQHHSLAEKLK